MISIRKITMVSLIVCFCLMLAGCGSEKNVPAAEEVDISQKIKVIEAFGLVKAEESKDVVIDFPAVILEVMVKEGQHVSLGDPIITLDISQYQTQIADKKSELIIAKLEHEQIINNLEGLTIENKESEIDKLNNELEFLKKQYAQKVDDFVSKEKLYAEGAVSEEIYNLSEISADEAEKNIEAAEYELKKAAESYDREIEQFNIKLEAEKDKASIQAECIRQIENNLKLLENRLDRPHIKDNLIVSEFKNASVWDITYASGHMTDTSQKAFSIINLDSLTVEADVVEEFIKDVQVGASVKIVPVADRNREYEGIVEYISQMAFSKNGETVVPVRISINNTDSFLLPNYNVDVFIDMETE